MDGDVPERAPSEQSSEPAGSLLTAMYRLLPYVLTFGLCAVWFYVLYLNVYELIGVVVAGIVALGFLWDPKDTPNAETQLQRVRVALRHPVAIGTTVLLGVGFGVYTLSVGRVHLVSTAKHDGPVSVLAIDLDEGDTTALTLNASVPEDSRRLRAGPAGRAYRFQREGSVAQMSLRSWSVLTLTYPDDFVGPVRVYGLLMPSLRSDTANVVRVTRGANGPLVAEDTFPESAPNAFVLAEWRPASAGDADSVRWVARLDELLGARSAHERLGQYFRTGGPRWLRSAHALSVGDSLTITVSRGGAVLATQHIQLSERVTDAILRRSP